MAVGKEVVLDVTGMTCEACAERVRAALESTPGVIRAEVHGWQTGRVTVVAAGEVAEELLVGAVRAAGGQAPGHTYRASVVEHRAVEAEQREPAGAEVVDLLVVGGGCGVCRGDPWGRAGGAGGAGRTRHHGRDVRQRGLRSSPTPGWRNRDEGNPTEEVKRWDGGSAVAGSLTARRPRCGTTWKHTGPRGSLWERAAASLFTPARGSRSTPAPHTGSRPPPPGEFGVWRGKAERRGQDGDVGDPQRVLAVVGGGRGCPGRRPGVGGRGLDGPRGDPKERGRRAAVLHPPTGLDKGCSAS